MPQIGWSELLVIAIIAILVIGPKDLPIIMKKFAGFVKTIKGYASQFQGSFENIGDTEIVDLQDIENTKKNRSQTNRTLSAKTQLIASKIPRAVATPFPPLNPW